MIVSVSPVARTPARCRVLPAPDGSDLHPIFSSDTEEALGPDFAPNGRKVAVELSGQGFEAIATVGLAHSNVNEIRRFDSPIGAPIFSPNGRRIAFTHAPGGTSGDSDVYTMRADGSHLRRITHTPGPKSSGLDDWQPLPR